MEQPVRQRGGDSVTGHSNWVKPMLGMRESYGITGAAERRRRVATPLRLGQTYSGNEGKLWKNRGGRDAVTGCQANQTEPNLCWE